MDSKLFGKKLGILGGGQLGKMLLAECNKMGIYTSVLDPSDESPCKNLASKFYQGDFKDYDIVMDFSKNCDVITFEIEQVNVDALESLEKAGKKVYPKSKTLRIVQDKNEQKNFFQKNIIPTADFRFFSNKSILKSYIEQGEIKFPCIWKKTKFGYDGFGVKILNSIEDIDDLPDTEMIIEDFVPFEKELSVIVSRNVSGEIKCFETVEMEFNSNSNQVEFVISPANISSETNDYAKELAIKIAKSLDCIGLLAVEMFLKGDEILVNEVAPRPHNSGHQTIEANITSQFEQHLRAILNYPLGSTKLLSPSVMLNILGEPNHTGKVFYKNFESCLSKEGVYMHIYGKKITKPFRKMGHVTIVDETMEKAKEKAKFVKETLKVISND